jgi:hypothetical protein
LKPERKIKLPLSATRRSQQGYAILLKRFDPRARTPAAFAWKGDRFRPGATIQEAKLWPDGTYPRLPLLLEFAGAENPDRGWNRHRSDETAVLWRYDRERGEFVEVGRVVAPNKLWQILIDPLIREEMGKEYGAASLPDLDAIRERIARVITAELAVIPDAHRVRVLTLVHDELASRICEWLPDDSQFMQPARYV